MIEFDKTADATAYAKKKCRDAGFAVVSVNSRWIPDSAQFRTTVLPGAGQDHAEVMTALRDSGFDNIDFDHALRWVRAFSALTGTSHHPAAELARRALVERLPESYSADEVSAMPDDEAVAVAVSCGLMEG